MATALFGGNAGRTQGKNLVEFRAGKMFMKGKMVHPDTRKGLVYVHQSEDELMHFCWKDRLTGVVEDDLIIFPDDTEFKFVSQCTTGRVYVLKFKSSSRRFFIWMQEPKTEKDDDYKSKVNEYLNNPPARVAGPGLGDLGAGGPGEIDIQNLLGNMTQQQLMQLVGGMGMGNMGSMGALSSLMGGGSRPGSTQSLTSEPPMRAPSTAPSSRADSTTDATPRPLTSATLPASETPSETPTSRQQIQLAELQSILHDINTPGPDDATAVSPAGPPGPNLSEALRTDSIIPILSNAEVQSRLIPLLPEGTTLPKTEDELRATVHSPQFQQAVNTFGIALQSGQLGPLMGQFGLGDEVVAAASQGDLEAFVRAMQSTPTTPVDTEMEEDPDNAKMDEGK